MIESLDVALNRATEMIANPREVRRIVLSGKRRSQAPRYLRVDIRPVEIKGGIHFQVIGHDGKQDTTKNVAIEAFSLAQIMNEGYGNLIVEVNDEELSLRITKSGQAQVTVRKVGQDFKRDARVSDVDLSHDRKKIRYLVESEPVFQALGISDHQGKLKPSRSDKFTQVNEFLKIIDQLSPFETATLTMVDLGCGSAYLTFAAHQFLTKKGAQLKTIGVDSRVDSRNRNLLIAEKVGISHEIEFVADEIANFPPREVDLTLALHACDTASDDALAWAINSHSKIILVAPCCHHDLQRQINESNVSIPSPWKIATRHGILKERIGDILTDAIRAQVLRILGYETDVIEFIDSEHTPRNLMIRAIFTGRSPLLSDFVELDSLIEQWQIQPRLMTLLSQAISVQRSKALS